LQTLNEEFVRWPSVVKPGTIYNDIFSQEDWMPTFLAAAGEPNFSNWLAQLKPKPIWGVGVAVIRQLRGDRNAASETKPAA
jgi:arylsulfatase A-like enzyme